MKITYYTLPSKTTSMLPQEAYFEGEKERYHPKQNETLPQFVSRIKQTNPTDLSHAHFEELVLASLIETTPRNKLDKYFIKTQTTPSLSQMRSFASTYARQLISKARSPHKNRSTLTSDTINTRISKCLGCTFHRSRQTASKDINLIANSAVSSNPYENLKDLEKLGGCGVCGCPLKAKVKYEIMPILADFLPTHIEMLINGYKASAFSRCWILNEALQSTNTKRVLINKIRSHNPSLEKYLNAYEAERNRPRRRNPGKSSKS